MLMNTDATHVQQARLALKSAVFPKPSSGWYHRVGFTGLWGSTPGGPANLEAFVIDCFLDRINDD